VDVLLRPPVKGNFGDEVSVALAALVMLPVKIRRVRLACKNGQARPLF